MKRSSNIENRENRDQQLYPETGSNDVIQTDCSYPMDTMPDLVTTAGNDNDSNKDSGINSGDKFSSDGMDSSDDDDDDFEDEESDEDCLEEDGFRRRNNNASQSHQRIVVAAVKRSKNSHLDMNISSEYR